MSILHFYSSRKSIGWLEVIKLVYWKHFNYLNAHVIKHDYPECSTFAEQNFVLSKSFGLRWCKDGYRFSVWHRWLDYFFNIGPFITIEIRPKAFQFTKDGIKFCHILNYAFRNCPKTCRILPIWWNFAKSGHTDGYTLGLISSHGTEFFIGLQSHDDHFTLN